MRELPIKEHVGPQDVNGGSRQQEEASLMTFMLAFQMTLRQVDRLGALAAACKGHLSCRVIYVCLFLYARGRKSPTSLYSCLPLCYSDHYLITSLLRLVLTHRHGWSLINFHPSELQLWSEIQPNILLFSQKLICQPNLAAISFFLSFSLFFFSPRRGTRLSISPCAMRVVRLGPG